MRLELRQLRHLLALNKYRSFARAAEALGLTQPALTRSIQTLEEHVGARLFDRDRSRVEPTVVGTRLIQESEMLLGRAEEVVREIQRITGLKGGTLRIGAGPVPASTSVGVAVGRLLQLHSGLKCELAVADWPTLTRQVLSGELELAVAEASLAREDRRLVVDELEKHRGSYFCRAGHPLTKLSKITTEDALRYPLVATSLPTRLAKALGRSRADASLDESEADSASEVRTSSYDVIRTIVWSSDAVSIALPAQIERDVALGTLVALRVDGAEIISDYGIIRLAHRSLSPAAEQFVNLLKEVERGLAD
jgi:DNA-binding transcriptional LysR family regulator